MKKNSRNVKTAMVEPISVVARFRLEATSSRSITVPVSFSEIETLD